jgi:hypothetical protein
VKAYSKGNEITASYPPTQKATVSETVVSMWRVPYEAHTSVVGCASEGSACLREAASAKAGPTKHVEMPRSCGKLHSSLA